MTDMGDLVREVRPITMEDTVETAVRALRESGLPSLPVVDDRGRLKGLFGEGEFLAALFPGYFKALPGAAFVRRSLDDALETRACRSEPVANHLEKERIRIPDDFSTSHLAETFLHHPVPAVPVVDDDDRPVGMVTRADFTARLAKKLLED